MKKKGKKRKEKKRVQDRCSEMDVCATYTRMHAHTYTYACICTRTHRLKISATTSQRVKLYHRRTYASICICMHIHTYTHIHICAQPAASLFADVYVGVETHLCNVRTCPCTSAQNTCKVHDDDCFYYHSWRNNVVIAFGTLSSFLT